MDDWTTAPSGGKPEGVHINCAVGGSFARVAIDLPQAQLGAAWFDYAVPPELCDAIVAGRWVLVPWGRGRRMGLVIALADASDLPPERIRAILAPVAGAPLAPEPWLRLLHFAARYYHRGLGELALPALPKLLRSVPVGRSRGSPFDRARAHRGKPGPAAVGPGSCPGRSAGPEPRAAPASSPAAAPGPTAPSPAAAPAPAAAPSPTVPSPAQAAALEALSANVGHQVFLLHGVTGSGKTEVYLRWLTAVLERDATRQVLLLVPEIALTPQLAAQVSARFPHEAVAVLHSDLADGERAAHWLAAAEGRSRVVIGTRLAVLAPLPRLAAIVVDEEHDASYKQQEGVRHSARDLAIVAAAQRAIPIVLGSATPSLESWLSARRGRYRLLGLPQRIGGGRLPELQVLDLRGQQLRHGLAPPTIAALEETLRRGKQALVFINRRGYAPVLSCEQCGWLSGCPNCSAYRVLHRVTGARSPARYRLVCHHCSAEQAVPRCCPDCGNVDLEALGRGTQRLEEGLAELFPGARLARLDRDVARRKGAAQQVLDAAHAGDVDILVGTQMLAKGHDFRRLSLVVAVDCDSGLYSADYRAPERLFATLMQVAGRAGRDARASRVVVQTRYPAHPLFRYLARHDYEGFADLQLAERRQVGLPPWRFQALLRAEADTQAEAIDFLVRARDLGQALLEAIAEPVAHKKEGMAVVLLDPVPMAMSRLAGRERAQLLVESDARRPLHRFLDAWLLQLREVKSKARWQLDVDPAEI